MTTTNQFSESAFDSMPLLEASRPSLSPTRYSRTAIALHWVLAVTVFALFGVGVFIANIPHTPLRLELVSWHQWTGMAFLSLTVVRIAWRLTHRPPELPATVVGSMPTWQRAAYRMTHAALYVMFLVVPLLGWAYSSAAGVHVVLMGVLRLPDIVHPDAQLAERIIHLHGPSGLVLVILALIHIAAALKHHFIDRDGLIRRMLPVRGW